MSKFMKQLRAIDDAELDPYQFRMLTHFWRVGQSWESLRTIAEKCGMSIGKASAVRNWLIDEKWLHYVKTDKGRLALELCSLHEQDCCSCSLHERECSPHETEEITPPHEKRSPHELKRSIPNEVERLSKDFSSIAGVFPSQSHYDLNWEEPLKFILDRAGDYEGAKGLIEQAVSFARNGESGTRYTVASPKSIVNIVANLEVEERTISIGAV